MVYSSLLRDSSYDCKCNWFSITFTIAKYSTQQSAYLLGGKCNSSAIIIGILNPEYDLQQTYWFNVCCPVMEYHQTAAINFCRDPADRQAVYAHMFFRIRDPKYDRDHSQKQSVLTRPYTGATRRLGLYSI